MVKLLVPREKWVGKLLEYHAIKIKINENGKERFVALHRGKDVYKRQAYRKPLEEQVLSLMKERRELYRKAPGGMRIQAINGELKELRKKIRLSQQIEKQSLEMEERLRQGKAQEQEMSGKQRRAIERNR